MTKMYELGKLQVPKMLAKVPRISTGELKHVDFDDSFFDQRKIKIDHFFNQLFKRNHRSPP